MNVTRQIKLMLVRIGDEKRDQIDTHLGVLKGKCVGVANHVDDTMQTMQQTLCDVVHNLPHKAHLYSTLIGLIASENPQMASNLVNTVVDSLK